MRKRSTHAAVKPVVSTAVPRVVLSFFCRALIWPAFVAVSISTTCLLFSSVSLLRCQHVVHKPSAGHSIDSDRLGLACTHLLTIAQALQSIDKKLDVVLSSTRVSQACRLFEF